MEFYEAQERAKELGFSINASGGNWFSAMKEWEGHTFALEVNADTEKFRFSMYFGPILIDSTWLGSYKDDVHFLRWQRHFMETIDKLPRRSLR